MRGDSDLRSPRVTGEYSAFKPISFFSMSRLTSARTRPTRSSPTMEVTALSDTRRDCPSSSSVNPTSFRYRAAKGHAKSFLIFLFESLSWRYLGWPRLLLSARLLKITIDTLRASRSSEARDGRGRGGIALPGTSPAPRNPGEEAFGDDIVVDFERQRTRKSSKIPSANPTPPQRMRGE